MIRSFVRLKAVEMVGLKGKQSTAVLQTNPGTLNHNARAKALVKAVDKGGAVALPIRHR